MRHFFAFLLTLSALLLSARAARAANPTKLQCITANEDADAQRKKGQLRAARASLLTCANAACPRLVRDDCNMRIGEVDAAIPTVTFTAKNGAQDTTAVTVAMDGESLAKEADGKPINVDPGEHSFTYTLAGFPPQTEKIVIREGEKARHINIQFGDKPKGAEGGPTGRLVVVSDGAATISIDSRSSSVGRFDGPVTVGSHEVKVSQTGKIAATRIVEVKRDTTETLNITLENEKTSKLPWIIGGAAIVVAAVVVTGIFVLKPDDKTASVPQGSLGGVRMASF